jgi:hypothetical protein
MVFLTALRSLIESGMAGKAKARTPARRTRRYAGILQRFFEHSCAGIFDESTRALDSFESRG